MPVEEPDEDLVDAMQALMQATQTRSPEQRYEESAEPTDRNVLAGIGMRLRQMSLPESTRHRAEQLIAEAVETGKESTLVSILKQKQVMGDRKSEADAVNRRAVRTSELVARLAASGAMWIRKFTQNGWTPDQLHEAIRLYAEQMPTNVGDSPELVRNRRDTVMKVEWFCAKWFSCGLPRVDVAQRLAASFAVSRVPADVVPKDLGMPWPCFVVDVPESLQFGEDSHKLLLCFLANEDIDGSLYCILGIGSDRAFQVMARTPRCIAEIAEQKDAPARYGTPAAPVLLRFLLGTILELQTYRPAPARDPRTARVPVNKRGEPQCTLVRLARDVKVDARPMVRAYLRGETTARGPVTVQSYVIGHWKMQPCGKGRADRVRIHVEPYWRGPDDAPIALRNHVLGTQQNEKRSHEE